MADADVSVTPLPRDVARHNIAWGMGTALASLALAFVVYIVGDAVLSLFARSLYTRHLLIFSIVSYQSLALGVAVSVGWLLMYRRGIRLAEVGFRAPTLPAIFTAIFSLIPIFIGVALLTAMFSAFFPAFHLQGNAKQELPIGTHVGTLKVILVLVWAAVEAPVVEETLFRGVIFQGTVAFAQRRLGQRVSVLSGAVFSGTLFGLAHFEPHTLPILIFLGIALAYVFYYTRSLFTSTLVHGAVNTIATLSVLHGS